MSRPAFRLKCRLTSSQSSSYDLSVGRCGDSRFLMSPYTFCPHSQQHSTTRNGITNSRHVVGHEILVQPLDKIRPIRPHRSIHGESVAIEIRIVVIFNLVATCNVVMLQNNQTDQTMRSSSRRFPDESPLHYWSRASRMRTRH